MMKKTLLKAIVTGALLILSASANAQETGKNVCSISSSDEIGKRCVINDILVLPSGTVPLVCDFTKEIVVLKSNSMAKFGATAPATCTYIGYIREIK